jgi:CheY-like chemotaxis protein
VIILIVDDSEDDVFFLKRGFAKAATLASLYRVKNGDEAIAYFKGEFPFKDRLRHPIPGGVILDLKMPGTSGFDVLRWIRRQPTFRKLPVVILTTSVDPAEAANAYELGAAFLTKPDFSEMVAMCRRIERLFNQTDGN